MTENTVQTHIRHIFQKLGVRSRTELAAKLLPAPADDRHEAPQRIRTDLERLAPPVRERTMKYH